MFDEDAFIKAILGQLKSGEWKRSSAVVCELKARGIDRGDLAIVMLIELEKMDCVKSRNGEAQAHEILYRGGWTMLEWTITDLGKAHLRKSKEIQGQKGPLPMGA